jgi:ElaB/YqjD/DUF883 family membrane-anchored ribosome-binding protein
VQLAVSHEILKRLGLEIGAALGAVGLMGETSDEVKRRTQALASDQYGTAMDAVQDTFEEAKKETEKLGSEVAHAVQKAVPRTPESTEEAAAVETVKVTEPSHDER